jgi:hypothetical protein
VFREACEQNEGNRESHQGESECEAVSWWSQHGPPNWVSSLLISPRRTCHSPLILLLLAFHIFPPTWQGVVLFEVWFFYWICFWLPTWLSELRNLPSTQIGAPAAPTWENIKPCTWSLLPSVFPLAVSTSAEFWISFRGRLWLEVWVLNPSWSFDNANSPLHSESARLDTLLTLLALEG